MNFNTPALLFGLILLVSSLALFVFGRLKPELQRGSDTVYAIIGIVCALILFGSAFDLSLGMSFQQLLMIGTLIALMLENIQARQPKNLGAKRGIMDGLRGWASDRDTARRGAPVMDDDRPSNRVYRAELEELPPLEDQRTNRRIRGGRDSRSDDWESPRRSPRRNEYADDLPRRPRGSLNGSPMVDNPDDRPRRRTPRSLPPDRSQPDLGSWGDDSNFQDDTSSRSIIRSNPRDPGESSTRPRRSRPNPDSGRRRSGDSSDYVDYQPVDYPRNDSNRDWE